MAISVSATEYHVLDLEKRMPFHFGTVEVTEDPQAFLRIEASIDGTSQTGIAMGGLVAPWFYKDPEMSLEAGFRNMIETFRSATEIARHLDPAPTPFAFWESLYESQRDWAGGTDHPPLLWSYGVSMVEQALIDAVCRHHGTTLSAAVRNNELGIDLGSIHGELADYETQELLPETPRRTTAVRHTVGLDDPLTTADVAEGDRLDDGLPQTLSEYVREDGVRHFKIKLAADRERDAARLARIHDVLGDLGVDDYVCTADANETYESAAAFKQQWEALASEPDVSPLIDRLAYIEQPLARDDAFTSETKDVFTDWDDGPPIIIDESDGRLDSARTALEYGYDGTSHKNCKGVFKGIANACLIERRNRLNPEREYVLSAEDLTTIGPIELLQDLAVVATIGAGHVERNGHHYFRGLSAFPEEMQDRLLDAHGDLYRRHEEGFATLSIEEGAVDLNSVVEAPFGVGPAFDASRFTPVETWMDDGLAGE
jgi:L-alanine-DL-glutamate epimerase-like enolase superfamily enzyme